MNAALAILFVLIGVMLTLAWASPRLYEARLREHRTRPAPPRQRPQRLPGRVPSRAGLKARRRANRRLRHKAKGNPRHVKKRLRARKRGDR